MKKMQEEKLEKEKESTASALPTQPKLPPLMSKKPLSMRMAAMRRKAVVSSKTTKPEPLATSSKESKEGTQQGEDSSGPSPMPNSQLFMGM